MKTEYTSIKVGDRIRILHLRDEDKSYYGREGIVEFIDSQSTTRYMGRIGYYPRSRRVRGHKRKRKDLD